HLAALPSELAGVLTGALLVATIAIDRLSIRRAAPRDRIAFTEDIPVKNTQVAILCAAILGGALIVAATNVWLVRSIPGATVAARGSSASGASDPSDAFSTSTKIRVVLAMMPKAKGDPYFVSCPAAVERSRSLPGR